MEWDGTTDDVFTDLCVFGCKIKIWLFLSGNSDLFPRSNPDLRATNVL